MSQDDALFVTDAEIIERMGLGEKRGRVAIAGLEREGFPRRDPLFANRRYWPAVKAFLDRRHGVRLDAPAVADEGENWDGKAAPAGRPRRRLAAS